MAESFQEMRLDARRILWDHADGWEISSGRRVIIDVADFGELGADVGDGRKLTVFRIGLTVVFSLTGPRQDNAARIKDDDAQLRASGFTLEDPRPKGIPTNCPHCGAILTLALK